MATKIFSSRPAGRKTKFRRKQAAAAASAPPSPPPAQRPLPQLPRWTLPFLWMSTVSITSPISRFDTQSSLFKLSVRCCRSFCDRYLSSVPISSCTNPFHQFSSRLQSFHHMFSSFLDLSCCRSRPSRFTFDSSGSFILIFLSGAWLIPPVIFSLVVSVLTTNFFVFLICSSHMLTIWFPQMVDSAVAMLPELVRSLTLGLPSRTPSQAARLNYVGMARKWEEEQDRRAQGGMAWMYSWEYMAGSKLLGRRGIRRSVSGPGLLGDEMRLMISSHSRTPSSTCLWSVSDQFSWNSEDYMLMRKQRRIDST